MKMDRTALEQYIVDEYGAEREHLWAKFPNYTVFRHYKNRKWFALIMDIAQSKIGIDGTDIIDVLDIRCDPVLIGSFLHDDGFYPAYHMNKNSWITIALDGRVDAEKIKLLLDMSFEIAGKK